MAIYGHMNKNQSPQDDPPPEDKADETPLEGEVDGTISSLLQEAMDVVKSTQEGVMEEKTNTEESSSSMHHSSQDTDQHFTIANSPTRFQKYTDTTPKD